MTTEGGFKCLGTTEGDFKSFETITEGDFKCLGTTEGDFVRVGD